MRKKKGNEKYIKSDELFEAVKTAIKSKEKLDAILKDLQSDNKIFSENGKLFAI